MDEDSQEDKPTYSRFRSPIFSKEEKKALLNLIEKYKSVILIRSNTAASNHAKEIAWTKITKAYNSQGFKNVRSAESLKGKWENLKKQAKKITNNLLDIRHDELDEVTSHTVAIMCEGENSSYTIDKPMESYDELNESDPQKQTNEILNWSGGEDADSNEIDGDNENENKRFMNRSMNFSPQECNLLIQCVRQEKKFVLSRDGTGGANKLKNRAWCRITNAYNKLSPQKRSTKVLRTKFSNMKKLAKSVNFMDCIKDFGRKHNKLIEDTDKKVKSEPMFEYKDNSEPEDEDIDDNHSEIIEKSNDSTNLLPDPLSTVFNGDSGIDIINPIENKEIVRLKMELLHYKMETAKLERKNIEEALQTQRLESSLRVRAARLAAVAAAERLPPAHPALAYTADEEPARHLLQPT